MSELLLLLLFMQQFQDFQWLTWIPTPYFNVLTLETYLTWEQKKNSNETLADAQCNCTLNYQDLCRYLNRNVKAIVQWELPRNDSLSEGNWHIARFSTARKINITVILSEVYESQCWIRCQISRRSDECKWSKTTGISWNVQRGGVGAPPYCQNSIIN